MKRLEYKKDPAFWALIGLVIMFIYIIVKN